LGLERRLLCAARAVVRRAILLIVAGSVLPRAPRKARAGRQGRLDCLLSADPAQPAVLLCLAMANGGIQTFAVVSLGAHPRHVAESPTSACRASCCSARAGVLLGGIIADRTPHHERVAAVGFACTSTMAC
jgi:hypothetical protein